MSTPTATIGSPLGVRIAIIRWVDDAQPGWVECVLNDVHGHAWHFIEKAPIVSAEDIFGQGDLPRTGVIACEIVGTRRNAGSEIVTITTEVPWSITSTDDVSRFDVFRDQLCEI
jgi:hypothetical protein